MYIYLYIYIYIYIYIYNQIRGIKVLTGDILTPLP